MPEGSPATESEPGLSTQEEYEQLTTTTFFSSFSSSHPTAHHSQVPAYPLGTLYPGCLVSCCYQLSPGDNCQLLIHPNSPQLVPPPLPAGINTTLTWLPRKITRKCSALPTLHSTPRMQLHPSWPGASGKEVSSDRSPPPRLLQEKGPGVFRGPGGPLKRRFLARVAWRCRATSLGFLVWWKARACKYVHVRICSGLKPHPSLRAALPLPVDLLSIKPLQRMTSHLEEKKKRQGMGGRRKKTTPFSMFLSLIQAAHPSPGFYQEP